MEPGSKSWGGLPPFEIFFHDGQCMHVHATRSRRCCRFTRRLRSYPRTHGPEPLMQVHASVRPPYAPLACEFHALTCKCPHTQSSRFDLNEVT